MHSLLSNHKRILTVLLVSLLGFGVLAACMAAAPSVSAPAATAPAGIALTWHREGGIAGFCDDVTVDVAGNVVITSCRSEPAGEVARFHLDAAQLNTLSTWVDTFQSFQLEQRDPAQADGMTVQVGFTGAGEQAATEPDQALMVDFAQNLYNEGQMGANEPPAACAAPGNDQQLLVQEEQDYCLLYPAAYSLVQSGPDSLEIVVDTVMNHIDPRVSITVEDANGRTLDEVIEQLIADSVQPGAAVDQNAITVGGAAAMMLDNLLGQDVYRRVALLHNGRLYSFFFAPIGEEGTATRQQADALYQTVIDSFRFLTETNPAPGAVITPAPLPIPAAADVVATEVQYIQALVNVNIRSGPGTNYGVVGSIAAGQVAQVTGIMPDSSWWRVICPDDSVGNCFVVNDPSLTQPATAPGGQPVPPADGNAPISETGEAIVESLEVRILESFPVQVQAVVRGQLPDPCAFIESTGVYVEGSTFRIRMTTARQPNQRCAQVLTPFEEVVPLGAEGLPAGEYDVRINDLVEPFTLSVDNGPIPPDPTGTTATYRDDAAGFSFDYHAPAWTVGEKQQIGPRGTVVQFTFASHAPEATTEETRMDVAVMDWDPKNDLTAYLETRKQAWAASGMTIASEEARLLPGDHLAVRFLVTTPDGNGQGFFLITTVGEQYLVLSGSGNLDALEAIAQTLRFHDN